MSIVQKVENQNAPITKDEIQKLAKRIRDKHFPMGYEKFYPNYFCITVSPTGKIYEPSEIACGHPQIMEQDIIDDDYILEFMLNNIFTNEFPSNIEWSLFGILFGYVNIDGIESKDENGKIKEIYNYKINPFALSVINRETTKNIKSEDTEIISFTKLSDYVDPKLYAIKVPFVKRELQKRLENRGVKPEEINGLFNTKEEYREFLDDIERRFAKIKENLFKILKVKDYQEIQNKAKEDNSLDIYQKLLELTNSSPDRLIDYLENYSEIREAKIPE